MLPADNVKGMYSHPIETPCGLVGDARFTPARVQSYEGKLCTRGCFMPSELARAAQLASLKAEALVETRRKQDQAWLETENKRRASRGMKPLTETPAQRMTRINAMTDEEFKQMVLDEEREQSVEPPKK